MCWKEKHKIMDHKDEHELSYVGTQIKQKLSVFFNGKKQQELEFKSP
jgi:hypothetical protein